MKAGIPSRYVFDGYYRVLEYLPPRMASTFSTFGPQNASGSHVLGSSVRQAPAPRPAPVDLNALQNASRVLVDQLAKDAQVIPDLGETLTGGVGQASGNYSIFPDDIRVPYQKRRFIGIPDGLFQFYDSVNVTTNMGIMPEIERVWISIDHKLFLWDYNDGQEIASFVDQPDVITHVALVKPKPGLFIDDITSLLVICTPVSVLLIGVSLSTGPQGERGPKNINLYATDFTVPCDVEMTSVVGTPEGRIFMCGTSDGNLYELHYQGNESWFAKRVQLINHSVGGVQSFLPRFASTSPDERIVQVISDPERNLIYTVTSRSSIAIYKPNGDKAVQHVQTLSNLCKAAQDKAPGSPALTPQSFALVSLHVVSPSESRSGIQLIGLTANGIRLFFGPSQSYYGYSSGTGSSNRPLSLLHVRLPPTNLIHPDEQASGYRPPVVYGGAPVATQPTSRPYVVTTLDSSSYHNGLTIAAQPGDTDGTDYILCLSPDLTHISNLGQLNLPNAQPIAQQYGSNAAAPSNRLPLVEYATLLSIPGRTWAVASVAGSSSPPLPTGTPSYSSINELATQFNEPSHQFMLLTNVGLTFLMKRRAVDYLKAVLEELQSEGNVQPIVEFRDSFGRDQTCAMLLALASGNTFLDGVEGPSPASVSNVSPEIATVAKQAFYDFGERPIWAERAMYGTVVAGKGWPCILRDCPLNTCELAVSEKHLLQAQHNLYALKDFLDRNPHLFQSAPSENAAGRGSISDQEAWKAENTSVSELQSLLSRTIEALSFVMLLNDYRLGDLIANCDADTKKLIEASTFEDLVTTTNGMTISRALVNVVIDQQIGQQISVDTISEVLQHRCGSFCSTDDVMLYKAKENIRRAAETRNPNERQKCLAEALRLFTKGARIMEFEKLREIIGDFQQLNYAKGAVLLPLACAQAQDPDNIGLAYWHTSPPANSTDPRSEFIKHRLQAYDLILDSLSVFEEKCSDSKAAGAVQASETPEAIRSHAYELAFSSEDEMFHSTLYDWLIGRHLADDLLEMRPPYLEAHLRRDPPTVDKYQLLWQFYVKNGQYLRAAEVLGALAESTEFDLELASRVEYLTLAVGNAKSHPISAGGRHETAITFLTDLEEKLDVAQVQLEIYQKLSPHIYDAPEVGAVVEELNKRLLTLTEYAVAFGMPKLRLLCLYVSEHYDEAALKEVWNQIIEECCASPDLSTQKDVIFKEVAELGQRYYPSESAFPLRYVSYLLVKFRLDNKGEVPSGWFCRLLVQSKVPFVEIWEILHNMYESQVPPFNDQANVQAISEEIAILLTDWLNEVLRPQSSISRAEFPAGRVDAAIDQYLAELEPTRLETKAAYEDVKRQLRRYW
ncbi:nucleoporin Nup157/170 [Coprinopsis cinerea okayama7|uniref:Nucleoporin Nup157/170 n=1 Tax=Coprinopsis cinerea (strain Okayama-7 / 130 / ATCC MYA-4618 / FGSC 9003) TaxID=240176 RepID=A8N1A2_COPC7|nr:nucleoporin Nup157/170 [Coprinopsis cinerea okayama7\|eukprot:XP_001828651.2 nucleoporin Nup157/170 [Coprinopsis cinerea okayama7\